MLIMDTKMPPPVDSSSHRDFMAISIEEVQEKQHTLDESAVWRCGSLLAFLGNPTRVTGNCDSRRLVHAVKVGLALVLVSLLYMLEVVHDRLGDNAMWAVMTVVVVFEFTSGATISKGVNRGVGTIVGGGLGSLVALAAQEVRGAGKAVIIGTSVSLFGAAATYIRLVPSIKKKYDYGVMIFILTFSLVAVSGIRGDEIIKIAIDRLSSICIGFAICVFISLFICPTWSGNELHNSLASKFDNLAHSIEECLEVYTNKTLDEKTGTPISWNHSRCLSVLSSKSADETLANFAKWEPWHGRFGFYHPWNEYLHTGELLREMAASILSLKGCLRYEHQPPPECIAMGVKERYETTYSLLAYIMRELGDSMYKMKRYKQRDTAIEKLRTVRLELSSPLPTSKLATDNHHNNLMNCRGLVASSLLLLVEIVDKLEEVVDEVDKISKSASFST